MTGGKEQVPDATAAQSADRGGQVQVDPAPDATPSAADTADPASPPEAASAVAGEHQSPLPPAATAGGPSAAGAPAPVDHERLRREQAISGATMLLPDTPSSAVLGMTNAEVAAGVAQASTAVAAEAQAAPPEQPGTVYGGEPTRTVDSAGQRQFRGFPRLRIGSHVANGVALGQMASDAPGIGVLMGFDEDQSPVTVRLFRPEPTLVALIGGLWVSQLVVFRALAVGARVVLFTNQPESWDEFGKWASGRSDRVTVVLDGGPVTVASSPTRPALLLYDGGLVGAARRPSLGPWQTQLTVLRQLTAYGFSAVQESRLVMAQRLAAAEAVAAASVLDLRPHTTERLQELSHDMLALVSGGAERYLSTRPTRIEQKRFGAPRR